MATNILEWCRSIIMITPVRWLNLVESVPPELLSLRPAANEWSALDCLQHLVETERDSFPLRIKALLAGQGFPGFSPGVPVNTPPAPVLAAEFDKLRQENLARFAQITEADLDRQSMHAEYGMVSMRQFLHHWAGHDLMHTVQAERALMQPLIQGSGPWQVNYTDHIARVKG